MKKRHYYILFAFLLSIISFPDLVSKYDLTIDPQIHWVFNSLFENNFGLTRDIIFPHGPLSFLEYPLGIGHNILLSSFFVFILHFLFSYCALGFFGADRKWFSSVYLLFIFLYLEYLDFELVLCGLVFLLIANHLKSEKNTYLIVAMVFSALAFYIKISIGVISASLLACYFIYLLAWSKKAAFTLMVFPLLLALLWLVMYQGLSGFFIYLLGVKELIFGNSDSASLYPDNNWIFLSCSLVTLCVFPFFGLSKENKILFSVSLLSMLAVWKHSMAREDAWHIMKFAYWVFFIGITLLLHEKRWRIFSSFALLISICFFYLNARSVTASSLVSFQAPKLTSIYNNLLTGIAKEKSKEKIITESENCLLAEKDLALIANSRVDCYPYNYCFVVANDLLWSPRPIIQSYAAYSPWLDNKNAEHFSSENSPEFIIWENDILKRDRWQSDMTSIDGRYLLHDEPKTIDAIFSTYEIVSKEKNYVLWKKRNKALELKVNINDNQFKQQSVRWGKWVSLPKHNSLLKLSAKPISSFVSKIKSALYKGEAVFIEYKTEHGIRKQKLTQKHLRESILISPLIEKLNSGEDLTAVHAIRITTHNPNSFDDSFTLKFSQYDFYQDNIPTSIDSIFARSIKKASRSSDSTLVSYVIEPEYTIASEKYAPALILNTDSLLQNGIDTITLTSSLEFNMSCTNKAKLVIDVQNNSEKKLWLARNLDKFVHHCHSWETMYDKRTLVLEQGDVVKVYVWNNGKEEVLVKGFNIAVRSD